MSQSSMNYLTPSDQMWAADIEADNLLDKATTIWCLCLINVVTKERHSFTKAGDFITWLEKHEKAILVGHNFLAYDLPMLNRHWMTRIPASRVIDTFVLSQMFNPVMSGGHSLEAWGQRLKYSKGDFNDFSKLSDEMIRYCMTDTILCAYLYRKLTERMRHVGFTEEGVKLEHEAWNIIQNKQKRNGVPFNYKRAMELYVQLRKREEELSEHIFKLWPPVLKLVGEYKQRRRKDGTDSAQYVRHLGQFPKLEDDESGGYRAYDYVAFNLGSPTQRIEKLTELGWQPVSFTKKGNPQVDEDSLLAYAIESGRDELKSLAKWIVINSRANMIRTWMDAYNPASGAIHGSLFIASTLRYRHSNPNSANIPAVRLKKVEGEDVIQYGEDGGYTYESRDLFWSGDIDGWSLVGLDGTGIQNRCLIHHLIKTVGEEAVAEFKELSLHGDIHKRNIEIIGVANKAASKKFYYTLMMGGGGERLANDQVQFGSHFTAKEASKKKDALISSMPGFKQLIQNLQRELERSGRIVLCDGTPLLVPSPHMVIPYLLQGDESRLMKKAMVFLDEEIRRNKLTEHCFKVLDVHDEWQFRVRNEYVESFVAIALPCFRRAGEFYSYRIPIDGAAVVGKTWAETH